MKSERRPFILGPKSLLLWIFIAGVIGALLHDFNGVPYGALGALLWAGGVLVTFVLGTAFLSRRLLPVPGNLGWSEGFRLLWRNYMLGAAQFLAGQRHELLTAPAKKKSPTPVLSPSFELLGAGFLFSHEAAAITRGNSYQRAEGPGLIFLEPGERIARVFDLRHQSRSLPVQATTRDGIPVEANVSVSFRVRRLRPDERRARSIEIDTIPYRYDRDAIFDLTYADSVAGDDRLPWTEQVCPQAATLLVSEIGRVTLDELLTGAGAEPLGRIRKSIEQALRAQQENDDGQVLPRGIEILGVGVGGLKLPLDVVEKRLTTWQVKAQNKVAEEEVAADIEVLRQYHQARAKALVEAVENLLVNVESIVRQSQAEYQDVVISRLLDVVDHTVASQHLRRIGLPTQLLSQTLETQSQLRQALEHRE